MLLPALFGQFVLLELDSQNSVRDMVLEPRQCLSEPQHKSFFGHHFLKHHCFGALFKLLLIPTCT